MQFITFQGWYYQLGRLKFNLANFSATESAGVVDFSKAVLLWILAACKAEVLYLFLMEFLYDNDDFSSGDICSRINTLFPPKFQDSFILSNSALTKGNWSPWTLFQLQTLE